MKSLVNKTLAIATLLIASAFSAFAQTRTVEHEYSPFDGVVASNGFKVTIAQSDSYAAKLTVDDVLESYVQCYVKANVLYLGLDDKNIPKEVKKMYKGKDAPEPTLSAIVYIPILNSLTLNDNSQFFNTGTLSAENFSLFLNGTTAINNLNVVAKTAVLSVAKNAKLTNANVRTEGNIAVAGDGKGLMTLEYAAENLDVNTTGSADLSINGNAEKVTVNSANSAKTAVSGEAKSLTVTGKGTVDASNLKVKDANLQTNGATVKVNASDDLELDLGKGSDVEYSGDPKVKIVKIQSSSVTRK